MIRCVRDLPSWIRPLLITAALYNLVWGAAVVLFPLVWFEWAGMAPPRYPQIWQCVGMIVGVYGVGYAIAAAAPARHWPLLVVGLLGKLLGPIGFVSAAWRGELPWRFGLIVLANDVIWWVPFTAALYAIFRFTSDTSRDAQLLEFDDALRLPVSQRGASLLQLSRVQPTLVVFLRHGGCTFCRQMLADLGRQRNALEAAGVTLAIVHMGQPMDGTLMLHRYGLEGIHQFSDPQCVIYHAFGLERAGLCKLISATVVRRAIPAVLAGHGVGKLEGDGFRMPGVFLLVDGRVRSAHFAEHAADRPDYLQLVRSAEQERIGAGHSAGRITAAPCARTEAEANETLKH